MKNKFISLGLVVMMLLGTAGCAMSTPATVGNIGGVEIPAGIYLLAQYNAYDTVSGYAELATGETARDVDKVLRASCTGSIGDEEITTDGADFVSRLTTRAVQYYAAVEEMFTELNGALDDVATAEAADTAASLWESNGELYAANGISQSTVQQYLLNAQKAQACLELIYGDGGSEQVSEDAFTSFVNDACYYLETVQFPLLDYSTYAFADADQTAQIEQIAAQCIAGMEEYATAETADDNTMLYMAAMQYVPSAAAVLGSTMDASNAMSYAGMQLLAPADLANYDGADGTNQITDAVDAAGLGNWTTINMGTSIMVVRQVDAFSMETLDQLKENYDLLGAMKAEELQARLYENGAAMTQNLDSGAVGTYKASKIKKSV